jgi:hypothetical protein
VANAGGGADDIKLLKLLAGSIVRAQGNIFVRELLRDKRLPIGTNKPQFEANLVAAIESGALTRAELNAWLDEVEGWGSQHVYLFHVPDDLASDSIWKEERTLKARLPKNLRPLWKTEPENLFPDERTLTTIQFDGNELRFVWHQRLSTWIHEKQHDQKDVMIDGDRYEMRAYRDRPDRSVQRFVLRLDLKLAAIFLEVPWTKSAHEQATQEIRDATRTLVEWSKLDALAVSDVIKNLDQMELDDEPKAKKVAAQRTRLSDGGTYVEFATDSTESNFKDSTAVRAVRRAVKIDSFTGSAGSFHYTTLDPAGKERVVRLEIAEDGRIRLWHQLKAAAVWEILSTLKEAEKWRTKARTGRS